ncbi:DUF6489 family protein [Inquilinus limosus]|uniref:DUF6489 family protein n=1 Tax=Inquilinus limosus TaxID=171674 RepID=UPI000419ECA7|nr:DUF6489 family protein [Inquilinus limosus]
MKVSIDIDCTPEEARAFFGLPDVGPMQQALLKDMEERMRANLAAMEPEALFRTWLPASIEGFETLQRAFWQSMTGGKGGKS